MIGGGNSLVPIFRFFLNDHFSIWEEVSTFNEKIQIDKDLMAKYGALNSQFNISIFR